MLNPKSGIKTGVCQRSILGSSFFLIYINDLLDNLIFSVKLFTDDTSLFSTVYILHGDLNKIAEWIFQ